MSLDCPKCKETLDRVRRKPWMRRIPGSKHYLCRKCDGAYLLIFNHWLLKRKPSPQKAAGSRGS